MRYLLDKSIIRYAIAGVRFGHQRPLSPLEIGSLSLWQMAEAQAIALFISDASYHTLQRLAHYDEVRLFLDATNILAPTRYHARWARRIRETTRLAREDAALIALATFGSDAGGSLLGTHLVVTHDQPMINGYQMHHANLARRLRAMTVQLLPPFDQAGLPRLATPDDLLGG